MKQLTIIGNLGSNAVRRTASDGKELMTFNVAVNAGQNQTVWFNCIGNFRDKLFEYLVKGQCVCVMGDLSARVYNGNLDLGVNIDRVELCGRAPETKTDSANSPSQPSAQSVDPSSQPMQQQLPINPLQ